MEVFSGKKAGYWCVVALFFCAVVLYARTLGYEYVWDDQMYLGGFRLYQGVAGMARAVAEPFFLYPNYYRPLAMLSFVVSREPWMQHAINVALHTVNVALVFLCARALMPREAGESRAGVVATALGALMFAMHPIAVEPVVWVSGRFDTLMCTFVLGTCLAALGGKLTRWRLVLVFVLFACAMGCKEAAIGLPVALPFLLLLKRRLAGRGEGTYEIVGRLVPVLAMLALAVVLYVTIRLQVAHILFTREGTSVTFAGDGILDKLNIAALAVTAFVKLMVNPWSHSAPLHPFSYEAGSGVQANTLVVLASVLALFVLAASKKPRFNFPLALLAGLAMSWPALHLIGIPNGENIISDRYALAPLALLLAGLAAVTGAWTVRRAPSMGASERRALAYAGVFGLLWAGALAVHSHATIPLWRNEVALWMFVQKQVPTSIYARRQYIGALVTEGRWSEAENEIYRMWQQYPAGENFNMTLGDVVSLMIVRYNTGNYEEALEWAQLLESDKEKLNVLSARRKSAFYSVRGMMEATAGHWKDAEHYMALAEQEIPFDLDNLFQYAHALFMTGQPEKAEEVFNRALAGSTKEMAVWAVEWRKTWQPPAKAAGRGAGAAASAPVPVP